MKKSVAKIFLPDYRFKKITEISSDFFSGAGLIVFDVDNTLVFSETTEAKKEIVDWFCEINNRYRCVCVSNSRTIKQRQEKIEKLLGCGLFLSRRKKPSKKLFAEITGKYNLGGGRVFVVGDRIFTDILFGNLNGAATVLVNPLSNRENILIKITRVSENLILFFAGLRYNKKNK